MKPSYYRLACAVLVFINAIILVKMQSVLNERDDCLAESVIHKIFFEKTKVENENENSQFNKALPITLLSGETILSEDVFSQRKIIFRFSTINCSACVDNEIETLINEIHKNPNLSSNICLLISHSNISEVIEISRRLYSSSIHLPIYLIPLNGLNVPLEEQNIPFYFTVDENNSMNNFMIPIKEKPEWTISYLNSLRRNFLLK